MTAKRPEKLTRWANIPTINGESGKNNVVEPSETKKNIGWDFKERPARNYQNWLHYNDYLWSLYIDDNLDQFSVAAQTAPNMTVAISEGVLRSGLVLTRKAAQNTGTITAPATNPRIDRIVLDESGSVVVITGAEAASPTPPAISENHTPLAQILLTTSHTEIVNDDITPERINPFSNVSRYGDTLDGDFSVHTGHKFGVGPTLANLQQTLHIESATPNVRISDTDSAAAINVGGVLEWYHGNNTTKVFQIGKAQTTNGDVEVNNILSAGIALKTNNTKAFYIDNSQDVGVGDFDSATVPSDPLHVAKNIPNIRLSDEDAASDATVTGGIFWYRGKNISEVASVGVVAGNLALEANAGDINFLGNSATVVGYIDGSDGGVVWGGATGASQGAGSFNIKSLYIDGVLSLTNTSQITTGKVGNFVDLLHDGISTSTPFDVDTSVTETTWESVGPTGAGADNTYTPLDDFPTYAKFMVATLFMQLTITGGTANASYGLVVNAREDGSTVTDADAVGIGQIRFRTNSSGDGEACSRHQVIIPLDSSRKFEIYWDRQFTGAGTAVVELAPMGYLA